MGVRRKGQDLNGGEKGAGSELVELIQEGRARIIGLVRQELLSGIKTTGQYEKLRGLLRTFPDEAIATPDYETAAKAGKDSRAKAVAVSVSAMLICPIARTREWSIFS